jgi:hypothetical protein
MDLLTLSELLVLVRMLADVVATADRMSVVLERHVDRRMHSPPVSAVTDV